LISFNNAHTVENKQENNTHPTIRNGWYPTNARREVLLCVPSTFIEPEAELDWDWDWGGEPAAYAFEADPTNAFIDCEMSDALRGTIWA
jgi:hypothetical protein